MGEDEAAQREAEHRAAALDAVGPRSGAGATVWARVVQDVLALHESARERYANTPDPETWERLHGTGLMLAVAIDQVLAFERRVWRLTGDAELAEARASFDAVGPDAKELRDLVAHLDEYAVGEGRRQRQTGKGRPLGEQYLQALIFWTDDGTTYLDLGDKQLQLGAAAKAAIDLAQVVERVRARGLEQAGQEADAALRRRFGMPPE
jgi:hypothetical protein